MNLQMDTPRVYQTNVSKTKQLQHKQSQKMKCIPTDII